MLLMNKGELLFYRCRQSVPRAAEVIAVAV